MDLSTIGRKLQRAQYLSPEDFAHDTRLVFQNAITYNSAQSMFGVVAGILASVPLHQDDSHITVRIFWMSIVRAWHTNSG